MARSELAAPGVGGIASALSHPGNGAFGPAADVVATGQAIVVINEFIRRNRHEPCSALVRFLQEAVTDGLRFDSIWHPAIGQLQLASADPEAGKREAATALALHLACRGTRSAEWSGPLPPTLCVVMDRWLLPAARHVEVRARPDRLELMLSVQNDRIPVVLVARNGGWDAENAQPIPQATDVGPLLIPEVAVPDDIKTNIAGIACEITDEMVHSCRQAFELLKQYAPDYCHWVTKVIRRVLPLDAKASSTRSGSRPDYPGAIHMSLPEAPVDLANMLVHEASHSYYYVACSIGQVDSGEDSRLYYSPAKGTERPLSRILLAFHAFANVALLYEEFIARGVDDGGYCERQRPALRDSVRQLYEPLRANDTLTPVGRGLTEPLAERLRHVNAL
jgi:HEXXH motif-containing protein